MKKWLFFIFSILVAGAVCGLSIFYIDNDGPVITVNSKPIIACDITSDDLLEYADAKDANLKSFFIEEHDLASIAESGKLTYVAIDNRNNISKTQVHVDVEKDINTYHIEAIDDLVLPVRTNLLASKYFALKNKCGWSVKDTFIIEGVDRKIGGMYSATISSRKYKSNNINVLFVVNDPGAPKIYLNDISIKADVYDELDYYYFEKLVTNIVDDNTDSNELYRELSINYKDVIKVKHDGTNEPGTYLITYEVKDSDGNVGKSTLRVEIDKNSKPEEVFYE